ncbi:HEAT repeat domain-containing protein [Corynebacterium nuruki]|uniref:HEAT repeat domain-containing protein n=1 Tax=Corynebacterium nuruki TaxID=1032851 RepID=UPI0002486151|nr:HEAT repeat domain-containing protein [Corynebacterium nuruki]
MSTDSTPNNNRLTRSYTAEDADTRLRATLAAGTDPQPGDIPALIAQCAVEPDFFVRDMLTWALTRHPVGATLPLLLTELDSPTPQAVAQALHTLSKIDDARAYLHITDAHLTAGDDEVARTAWRTAAGLAGPGERTGLAARLRPELGRGDRELRRSLTRAFLQLGDAAEPVLRVVAARPGPGRAHALTTLLLLDDPSLGFDAAEAAAATTSTTAGTGQ